MQKINYFFLPHSVQYLLCTLIVPPHFGQVHLFPSLFKKFLIPWSLINTRFSISLILYPVRYLLSKCFRVSHGKSSHSKQYFALPFRNVLQFLILHCRQLADLLETWSLQPGHLFLSLKYAEQIPQFIPHGAIRKILLKDCIYSFI